MGRVGKGWRCPRARATRAPTPPHPPQNLYVGHGDAFEEVDVPAPARVCDLRKALRALLQLSGLQMARTELRVVAAGGPQPAPGAVSAALAGPRAALDASAPLGSPAAGFGGGAWLVARELAPQQDCGAAARSLSATAMVAPTFEAEARVALEAGAPRGLSVAAQPQPPRVPPARSALGGGARGGPAVLHGRRQPAAQRAAVPRTARA